MSGAYVRFLGKVSNQSLCLEDFRTEIVSNFSYNVE